MRLRRRRPQSSPLEQHIELEQLHRVPLPGGLSIEQGLAESNVRAGPDTSCIVGPHGYFPHELDAVEHRFMPDDPTCICGQVRVIDGGWRGRRVIIVRAR